MAGKRRWLQFSLRSFLLMLTVFGVWLGLHVRSAKRQAEAVAAIKEYGGWVYYDFQKFDPRSGKGDPKAESRVPRWLLSSFGEDYFHDVEIVNLSFNDDTGKRLDNPNLTPDALPNLRALYLHQKADATDDGMKHIGGLKKLEVVMMWDASEITDAGIVHLKNLKKLHHILFGNSRITDESLKTFSQMPHLEKLSLQGNRFTDQGLAYLQEMQQLKKLWIGQGDNDITDAGVVYLKGLANLEELDLQGTGVTAKGLEQLTGLRKLKLLVPGSE